MKGLEKLKEIKNGYIWHNPQRGDEENFETIEKELEALNEIVALHDKWLGNEMSDFEFFTLLNDIKYKYGLENEVLK